MFDKNLVHAIIGGKDLDCRSAELSVNLGLTRGHGPLLLDPSYFRAVGKREVIVVAAMERFSGDHVSQDRPGSSRRWIWNRERRSAPAESQHSFPSSIGRQAPFSNICPTVPPPSALGNRC